MRLNLNSVVTMRNLIAFRMIENTEQSHSHSAEMHHCWLIRVSLFIELGGAGDLGTRKRGAFSTFMISGPILHGSYWWKF